jgi:aminoglycoside phosphotransferase family enzyme
MELHKKIDNYLKERFGPAAELESLERKGKGVHGVGYLLTFAMPHGKKELIMKSLVPSGFGHDHFSDRAQVLLLANDNYNVMEKHIKALDVVGDSPDRFIPLNEATEFYLFMERAPGTAYFKDLDAILDRGRLERTDREKARGLARHIAGIHQRKYEGQNGKTLYRRRIRELIGHGECIMGIIDTYDRSNEFTTDQELLEYAKKSLLWWGKIRDKSERLCTVHGDFHPGNIWFQNQDFTLLDRSRGTWGEPADDVTCLSSNYIYYALKEHGTFKGPFAELFHIFNETYREETLDHNLFDLAPPFFAFRMLVIAHPRFYPDDSALTRRKLLNFGKSVLEDDRFHVNRVNEYLEGSGISDL